MSKARNASLALLLVAGAAMAAISPQVESTPLLVTCWTAWTASMASALTIRLRARQH